MTNSEVNENLVELPKTGKVGKGMGSVGEGTIGSVIVKEEDATPPKKIVNKTTADTKEKVAIYSTRNVSWDGVGSVIKGYNIVSAANAEKWLTRDHTRIATPEELAKEFDK